MQVHELLQQEFIRAQARSPHYSLRAFSRRLGISPSALSEIFRGKRKLTRKCAEKLLEKIALSSVEKERLLKEVVQQASQKSRRLKKSEIHSYVKIEESHYHVLSDWYCFAALALTEIEGYEGTPAWIAKKLRIKVTQARSALQTLARLDLLARGPDGKYRGTGKSHSIGDGMTSAAIQKAHRQGLELAVRSLEEDPLELRDFSAMNMAIDPEKLPEAKKMIRDFRRRLSALLESGRHREVYRLNVQIFPLTKNKETP